MADEQRWRDPHPDPAAPSPGTSRVRRLGQGVGSTARATGRGVTGLARGTKRASSVTVASAKRASEAQGAGESGLSRLIQMHVFNTAGDAAVAISLAGSLFFQVPSGEARGQVALFLGLTMLPFAIVAPLIGPFLDRFAHGRRWAIGATMAIRAFLCWVLASEVASGSALVFAAALGVLVSSKAYGVTRAAAVPRLLPRDFTLVKANGRVSLAGIVGASISAPIAALASLAGSDWSLRYAFLLFVIATILAIRLPAASRLERGRGRARLARPGGQHLGARTLADPDPGAGRVRAAGQPRALVPHRLPADVRGVPAARPRRAAGEQLRPRSHDRHRRRGGGTGPHPRDAHRLVPAAGSRRRWRWSSCLLAGAAASLLAALFYSVWTLALLGLVAGLAQAIAKFSLDATIQRDVPTTVQASAFGRSDTTCQLAWVIGGFVGIALPLDPPRLGLLVAFAVLVSWSVFVVATRPRPGRRPDVPREGNRVQGVTDAG